MLMVAMSVVSTAIIRVEMVIEQLASFLITGE